MEAISKTLDAFITKTFRTEDTQCPNDVLAFKLHYFKYIFDYLILQYKHLKSINMESKKDLSDQVIANRMFDFAFKSFISEEENKIRLFEDKFLRELIRQFPYKDCALMRQMVVIMSRINIGSPTTTALYVITSCLNGQRYDENNQNNKDNDNQQLKCTTCGEKDENVKRCSHCKNVAYCDQFCQRIHWPIHKKEKIN
jgi:ankyrin repeat and MYND domain-containing protein 2